MTSYEGFEGELHGDLAGLGRFRASRFRGVSIGNVDDIDSFLNALKERMPLSVSRVVPIHCHFTFKREDLDRRLKECIRGLAWMIGPNMTFSVRVTRRGLKGMISSQDIAREIGLFICDLLEERDGLRPRVNLTDPDVTVFIETVGNWCGVGIASKSIRLKYSWVRW